MKKFFFGILFLSLTGLISSMIFLIWIFWHYGQNLPDYYHLAKYEPLVVTRVHAANGALLAEFAKEKRVYVPTKSMPPLLINAFLSAEDKSFYSHFGIDLLALVKASIKNIISFRSGKRPVGASTITQQVAKNFLLTNEVSLERKIKEGILAIRIERAFSKNKILALYLNEIYLGMRSFGVAAASLNYFDKALNQLELHEMAYLAALPKAPSNYHPYRATKSALNRRNWVLDRMKKNGFITEEQLQYYSKKKLGVKNTSGFDSASAPFFTEEVRRILINEYGKEIVYGGGLSVRTSLDPILQKKAEKALIEGLEALDKRQGWRGALKKIKVNQNIDKQLEKLNINLHNNRYAALVTKVNSKNAEIYFNKINGNIPFEFASWAYPPRGEDGIRPPKIRDLREALEVGDIVVVQKPRFAKDLHKENFFPKPNDYALGQIPKVQGAIVAIDPHTGRILAMVGGYNYKSSEFNRVIQAKRQPGSAFKPFVYLAALDEGYAPNTRILDAPIVIDQGPGKSKWKPANYTKKFYGPSIMRVGIEKSRNLMTARLALSIGMPKIQKYARKFSINDDLPSLLSMSLGAGETTLLKLTNAYGQIVNGGKKTMPSLIDRIQDRYGKTIFKNDKRVCEQCLVNEKWSNQQIPILKDIREQITEPASAFQMISMLEGVISRGTGRKMANSGLVIAGKTGTTNKNTDGWFIGFSPDLVAGVYVGYDKPRPLGKKETGSTVAVPIFKNFVTEALKNTPLIPFRRPDNIKIIPIHSETGERVNPNNANAVLEVFKPGQRSEPREILDMPGSNRKYEVDAPALY